VAHDLENFQNFGISRNSRGRNVTNIILNTYAKNFFGVDPIDSAPPMSGSSERQYHTFINCCQFYDLMLNIFMY
jgi:hypothetical protein